MLTLFLIRLSCGMAWAAALLHRRDVATEYFRILLLVMLGLLVLAGLSAPGYSTSSLSTMTYIAAGVAFYGSILWQLQHRFAGAVAIWVLVLLTTGGMAMCTVYDPKLVGNDLLQRSLHLLGDVAAAGTLGICFNAMLLGHRYLTAPGMPLRPLHQMNNMLAAAVVLRAVVSATQWFVFAPTLGPMHVSWLALRWLAGIVGPAIAVLMVVGILKHRNTQSATGVLFAAVILTFIGELTGDLLRADLRMSL